MFRPRLLLGPVLAAALLLSACGGENPRMLPQDRAQALSEKVDEIGQRTSDEDCEGAEAAVQEARAQVTELPQSVSVRLRANLLEWVNHLAQEVPKDCKPKEEETPTPSAAPEETPTPSATPEETPTEEPTPDATEAPPPEEEPAPTVEPPGTGGVSPGDEGESG